MILYSFMFLHFFADAIELILFIYFSTPIWYKDGYKTTEEIRNWEAQNLTSGTTPIPIIALSANVMSNVAEKCARVGFTSYISKPVNFAALSDVIRGLLKKEKTLH